VKNKAFTQYSEAGLRALANDFIPVLKE